MKPVYIIAEAGVNHNGDDNLAYRLVDLAVEAGADAVKFQTFKAENLVTERAVKADYQQQKTDTDETQYAMLKRLELSHQMHHKLAAHCKEHQIEFLSTAFDSESISFLVNDLGLTTLKIPSGEITNGPLLLEHALTGCNLILSSGMATLGEVEQALGVIAFGLLNAGKKVAISSVDQFREAYFSEEGQTVLSEKVTLLHCTTEYPAQPSEINLNAMTTMEQAFGLRTGYSDHSEGITVPIVAAVMGAMLIEKHFTTDKNLPGPDHKASLDPIELKEMIKSIRTVEQVMGNGIKTPMPSEIKNRQCARKSLVAARPIAEGEAFSADNLVAKRPGDGISPMEYWQMLDESSDRAYETDEQINER